MKSIAFPNIFRTTSTNIVSDKEATASNLKLLLQSYKKELFGDPYFGTNLLKLFYEQNNIVLRDLVLDDIYVTIQTFMPQVDIDRKNISIVSDRYSMSVNIRCINKLDYSFEDYTIKLISGEELE